MKAVFGVIGAIFLLIIASLALVAGGVAMKGCSVGTAVIDRVVNSDNIVQSYEWYEQQYRDIKAIDTKIAEAEKAEAAFKQEAGPRDKWTFDDRQESARLANTTSGLKQAKAQMINDYNARSAMITHNGFKGRNLPERIDDTLHMETK